MTPGPDQLQPGEERHDVLPGVVDELPGGVFRCQPLGERLVVVGRAADDQAAARRDQPGVPRGDLPGGAGVEEVQDRAEDDAYRFGRVDDGPQFRVGQHRGGVAQVRRDRGHTGAGEQRAGVRQHHRVQVDVGHPGSGQDRLRGLVNCGGSGQPGAQVEELADSPRWRPR